MKGIKFLFSKAIHVKKLNKHYGGSAKIFKAFFRYAPKKFVYKNWIGGPLFLEGFEKETTCVLKFKTTDCFKFSLAETKTFCDCSNSCQNWNEQNGQSWCDDSWLNVEVLNTLESPPWQKTWKGKILTAKSRSRVSDFSLKDFFTMQTYF